MPHERNGTSDLQAATEKHNKIESDFHADLEAARKAYETASADYKRAIRDCESKQSDPPLKSDPSISEAISAQRHAFEKYRRTLERFNRFIIYGDLTDETD